MPSVCVCVCVWLYVARVRITQVQAVWDRERVVSDDAEARHARGRRTRRINEMLCYRIYKRNQILPIKQQVFHGPHRL